MQSDGNLSPADFLPDELLQQIQAQLHAMDSNTYAVWRSASADEDTITGDFLSRIRDASGATSSWNWNISYTKFQGRGPRATEKLTGADGIVQLEVRIDQQVRTKSLFFQAKKEGNNAGLAEQKAKMESFMPNASCVFQYGPERFVATASSGALAWAPVEIGEFLAERFLTCQVGRRDCYYDALRKVLIGSAQGDYEFRPQHGVRIKATKGRRQ